MDSQDELKLLQGGWIKLWHTYITWFTWHFVIHMTIIAGFLSIPALQKQDRIGLWVMLGFALLGLGATCAMVKYEAETRQRLRELDPKVSWAAFGGSLSRYGGVATFATTALLVCIWVYLIAKWPLT